jgi:3D (Asp-Asp-Asp) domain-containing protein
MNINKTILATGLVVACSASYLTGYYHGGTDIAEELQPRLTELQAKNVERQQLIKDVKLISKKVDKLQETIKVKNEQLAIPVKLHDSQVPFESDVNVAKFVISAYSPYDDRNYINSDGNPNNTATGTKPRPGTFAVDPHVIPYGSKVTILYADGTMEQGIAEDTGGAIKNNRIDVFRYTYDSAMQFGKKEAIVIWQ